MSTPSAQWPTLLCAKCSIRIMICLKFMNNKTNLSKNSDLRHELTCENTWVNRATCL